MSGRPRFRFRLRVQVPAVVLAACVAFGAVAACWSVLMPLTEAPDEPAHLALVLHLAEGKAYPSYDGLHNQTAIIRLCATYAAATLACPRPGEPVTLTSTRLHPRAQAPSKAHRPAWNDEGGDHPLGQLNQMPQHPPLYYQAMALVLRGERGVHGGPMSTDRELALLRLVNALLLVPLPALAWWAARRLRLREVTAVTAALVPFGLPMLTHIGSTLNNDNLLTLFGSILIALLCGVVRGDRRWQTGVAVGVVAGLALLTKAFAIVFPPVIVVAYLIGWRAGRAPDGDRATARPSVLALGAAGLTTAVLSAWWYVDTVVRTGKLAPTIEDRQLTSALRPPGFHAHLGPFLAQFGRSLDQRFWGSFGWYTVRLSTGFTYTLTAVVGVAVVAAFVGHGDEPGEDRVALGFLLLPMAFLGAFVVQHAWKLHVLTSKYQFIQGRYLLAGVVGLAVVVAVGVARGLGRWAPVGMLLAALALQSWAAWRCLVGYWGGPGLGPRGQFEAMVAWSGWPGLVVGALFVLAAASVGVLGWRLVVDLRGPQAETGLPLGSEG